MIKNKAIKLSAKELLAAYGFKIICGCIYGYIYLHSYGGDDTWEYSTKSFAEYQKLLQHPAQFFYDLSPNVLITAGNTGITAILEYLKHFEFLFTIKFIALFNFFSGGNYYINVVVFNFMVFWGHYWLFSLLVQAFPSKRKALLFTLFFIPSIIFWLSGIRSDGWLFFCITLALYCCNALLQQKYSRNFFAYLLTLAMALLGIVVFRNAALIIVPALASWFFIIKKRTKPLLTFVLIYGVCMLLFFASSWVSPRQNLPNYLVQKQQEFFSLKGTAFKLDSLQPTAKSFAVILPQALNNTFIRPYSWEAKGILQLLASAEIGMFLLLIILFFIKKETEAGKVFTHPLILSLLFFAVFTYAIIGYTVPFPGAIIRYKAIAELFLVIPFVVAIRWKKLY